MISQRLKDMRKGYRLTEEAYKQVSWTEDNPCYCSACSRPPCGSCEHGLSEEAAYEQDWCWEFDPDYDDEARELEEEPNEMSRDNIINKGSEKPKSEWFGFKYKVNPETSKLLQEAVFKDGGDQVKNYLFNKPHLFVSNQGSVTWGDDDKHFDEHPLPEKEPPQPNKTLNEQFNDLIKRLGKANNTCVGIEVVKERPEGKIGVSSFEYNPNLNFLNQQEESNMSNANRRVVNVKLLDNDSGLPVENSLVAQFDNIVTEDSNDVVVQEILLNKNIADAIAKHNQKRVEQTDLEILKRTGNDVKLRPVKLKDLTWVVTTA